MPISLAWPVRTLEAAAIVAWGNAFLTGSASLDDAAEGMSAGDAPVRVHGLPGGDSQAPAVALGRLATLGAQGLRLLLPVTGDPVGLPPDGPWFGGAGRPLPVAAIVGLGGCLVPFEAGSQAHQDGGSERGWRYYQQSTELLTLPGLREAERALGSDLRDAIEQLAALDVAGHTPSTRAQLDQLQPPNRLPPGYPAHAQVVLDRAWSVRQSVGLAADDPGAAVSAAEMATRQACLQGLETSSRYALMAAYNVPAEDLS